jgi:IS1 family transposase
MLDMVSKWSDTGCMNRLSNEDRAGILHLLCEGMSIRAITRLTGASKNTVAKLLIDAGKACMAFHDANVHNIKTARVQADEIWSFTYAKQKNVATAKDAPEGAGDTWTWTAIDADTKLIISYLVGGRDSEYAMAFIDDLRQRVATRFQLTSDGLNAYIGAVEEAFGDDIDFAQLVKAYGNTPGPAGRYSPPECIGAEKRRIRGRPDIDHVSTSFVERSNLTMRMHMRRFTRLTNAFSKKVENHAYAVALHMMYYNFVRIHKTLRMTPAMAAGVSDRLWEIADIAKLVEDAEAAPARRGSYKKRAL